MADSAKGAAKGMKDQVSDLQDSANSQIDEANKQGQQVASAIKEQAAGIRDQTAQISGAIDDNVHQMTGQVHAAADVFHQGSAAIHQYTDQIGKFNLTQLFHEKVCVPLEQMATQAAAWVDKQGKKLGTAHRATEEQRRRLAPAKSMEQLVMAWWAEHPGDPKEKFLLVQRVLRHYQEQAFHHLVRVPATVDGVCREEGATWSHCLDIALAAVSFSQGPHMDFTDSAMRGGAPLSFV